MSVFRLHCPDGEEDGITIMDPEKVFRVEYDGQYFQKMNKLCLAKDLRFEKHIIDNSNILISFLNVLNKENEIVSVELIQKKKK